MLVETSDERDRTLDSDAYLVELSTTPMKLYFLVDGRLTIEHRDDTVRFSFDRETTVLVGARSFHDRPAGTITVTDDVRDAMRAVSRFGSALKTLSPERSFPTLRGHPPLVERGEEFAAPNGLEPAETDVELVVPPDREHVYPIVSLAYYLGATVVPGHDPRLVAGSFERSLDGPDGYVETVNRILRQTFFLDCLTRTEGYYKVELHEREAVEPLVDLDFADLYETPLPERLAVYLSVPFGRSNRTSRTGGWASTSRRRSKTSNTCRISLGTSRSFASPIDRLRRRSNRCPTHSPSSFVRRHRRSWPAERADGTT